MGLSGPPRGEGPPPLVLICLQGVGKEDQNQEGESGQLSWSRAPCRAPSGVCPSLSDPQVGKMAVSLSAARRVVEGFPALMLAGLCEAASSQRDHRAVCRNSGVPDTGGFRFCRLPAVLLRPLSSPCSVTSSWDSSAGRLAGCVAISSFLPSSSSPHTAIPKLPGSLHVQPFGTDCQKTE